MCARKDQARLRVTAHVRAKDRALPSARPVRAAPHRSRTAGTRAPQPGTGSGPLAYDGEGTATSALAKDGRPPKHRAPSQPRRSRAAATRTPQPGRRPPRLRRRRRRRLRRRRRRTDTSVLADRRTPRRNPAVHRRARRKRDRVRAHERSRRPPTCGIPQNRAAPPPPPDRRNTEPRQQPARHLRPANPPATSAPTVDTASALTNGPAPPPRHPPSEPRPHIRTTRRSQER